MKYECRENYIIELFPEGRLDASNAEQNKEQILKISEKYPSSTFVINAEKLSYISSYGLRMILSLRKMSLIEKITNVQPDVYDLFQMTGFTGFMDIEKKLQKQTFDDDRLFSKDFYGKNYILDDENIVRVYAGFTDIEAIRRGVEYSKLALKYNVNAAVAHEPSMSGNQFSCKFSVGKDIKCLRDVMKSNADRKENYLCQLSILIHSLHNNMIVEERPEDLDEEYCRQIRSLDNGLSEEEKEKLCKIIKALPAPNSLVLKDISGTTIIEDQGQLYFTDLSMIYWGSPILELASLYVNCNSDRLKEIFKQFTHYYIYTDKEEELSVYYRVMEYIAPIIRLIRDQAVLKERNKKQASKAVDEIRNQILSCYDQIIESIYLLNDYLDNTVKCEIPYKGAEEILYLKGGNAGAVAECPEADAELTIIKRGRDLLVTPAGENCEVQYNGNKLTKAVHAAAGDIFSINGVYLTLEEDGIFYYFRKSLTNRLNIDIRERTATKFLRKKLLLKNIHMVLNTGEMVLLVGGSGAGKTTFMNAVTGYEKADATIKKGDVDFYQNYSKIRHKIAFAPQQDLLRNEDTVYFTLENAAQIRLPIGTTNEFRQKKITEMLQIFGLEDLKDEKVATLSGGQRKRLSIGVELIADPEIFFLDEPDSGLDGVMARSLMEDLRKITGNERIIIVISHSPDRVIDLFDKVIILAKSESDGAGHLAFFGKPEDAREFFDAKTIEAILKKVNRSSEGGEGRADEFIEKYDHRI